MNLATESSLRSRRQKSMIKLLLIIIYATVFLFGFILIYFKYFFNEVTPFKFFQNKNLTTFLVFKSSG